eukprot:TRINITY_DN3301_c2_g1_i1.p1 TRINITY_DN3301_c2_g1~~TRINITY_DN3301_c2_g1_i1.p1  ORF type:complete len:750 (+),score=137.38 TRINITY_DN3301_c2_g1_i1:75-2252(+)
MNFGKWLGIGGIKDFPYDIGEVVEGGCQGHWVQKEGKRNSDNLPVTIFEFSKKEPSDQLPLATNGWKRTKTLLLPGFLQCLTAVETPTHYYIATEECVPLGDVLSNDTKFSPEPACKEEFIAYGLHSIIQALAHLHDRKLLHANCNLSNIFVTKSGDWKLWGLDWVTNLDDEQSADHFRIYSRHLKDTYKSPELLKENWSAVTQSPVHAVDAWAIACLIYEVFNEPLTEPVQPAELKGNRKNIPKSLFSAFGGMLATQPKMRKNPSKMLTNCEYFTDSEFIEMQKEIDELTLKDQADRDAFFRKLAASVESFPLANCKFTILPKLTTALQFGSGGAAALEPILKIGSRLNEEEYTQFVVPGVTELFSSTEPIVRIKLLQNIKEINLGSIPKQLLCNDIWPHLSTGFTSKVPMIRELTVIAMVPVVPCLTEKLVAEVADQLSKLQWDREGGIRTNATICLGLIASHLPASSRAATLVTSFSRVLLKDNFNHSRAAALSALHNTIEYYDAVMISKQILPVVVQSLVDSDKEVRVRSLKATHAFLKKIESTPIEDKDPSPSPPAAAAAENGRSTADSSSPSPVPSSGSGINQYVSWAGSVVSKLGSRPSEEQLAEASPKTDGSQRNASFEGKSNSPTSEKPTASQATPTAVPAFDDDDDEGWGDPEGDDSFSSPTPAPVITPKPKVDKPTPTRPSIGSKKSKEPLKLGGLGLGGAKIAKAKLPGKKDD